MCGIVGYVGPQSAERVIVQGLRRLEYRGYDSAGVVLLHEGGLVGDKRAGKLSNLDAALEESPLPESSIGIGHTRWATHGPPTDRNAHPHRGQKERVAVVRCTIATRSSRCASRSSSPPAWSAAPDSNRSGHVWRSAR